MKFGLRMSVIRAVTLLPAAFFVTSCQPDENAVRQQLPDQFRLSKLVDSYTYPFKCTVAVFAIEDGVINAELIDGFVRGPFSDQNNDGSIVYRVISSVNENCVDKLRKYIGSEDVSKYLNSEEIMFRDLMDGKVIIINPSEKLAIYLEG